MTTIVVVRKNGYAAIAADTLTKWGSGKESADYVANNAKIVKVGDTWIACSGTSTFKLILRDYFAQRGVPARFDTSIEIFKTWQAFHAALKEKYYLVTVGDKDDTIESSKFDALIANPHGIFGVGAHRTVQEYRKFYAIGTGTDLALGAMYAAYDRPGPSAEQVARLAVEAAAEFDDGTGLPVTSHAVKLRRR
ncbi:MAG TPA: MFS transporter [Burkholderiales bacterium]|jgi:ATP-dependent protease HslVU (ClpYQ) peptidase subunit